MPDISRPAEPGPLTLRNRIPEAATFEGMTKADHTTPSLCIHCNTCTSTLFSGTRCVLAPAGDAGPAVS